MHMCKKKIRTYAKFLKKKSFFRKNILRPGLIIAMLRTSDQSSSMGTSGISNRSSSIVLFITEIGEGDTEVKDIVPFVNFYDGIVQFRDLWKYCS
ncbi:hypothetical protein LXL04_037885 [Taraxacum kok-saghyz]